MTDLVGSLWHGAHGLALSGREEDTGEGYIYLVPLLNLLRAIRQHSPPLSSYSLYPHLKLVPATEETARQLPLFSSRGPEFCS